MALPLETVAVIETDGTVHDKSATETGKLITGTDFKSATVIVEVCSQAFTEFIMRNV